MDTQNSAEPSLSENTSRPGFMVVGIGASAGGYPALATLLQNLPPAPGMALIVILHLATGRASAADRVLQGSTDLPVVMVRHTMPILPDHIYVIPPDRSLKMRDSRLVLDDLDRRSGQLIAIDVFFRTLAEAHRENAIGVILSGMGSDGTAGLACIKEQGGITIAQSPEDAEEGGMPHSAIESGMADFVLPAAAIPQKLIGLRDGAEAIWRHARQGQAPAGVPPFDMGEHPREMLKDVLSLLHARTGHDFRQYRQPTLLRRLERRLQVRGMADLPSYCRLLEEDAGEPHALLKDLLIGVTSFFRERDAFEALNRLVLPALFEGRQPADMVRAWITACSTGEEAYTVAMLLDEYASAMPKPPRVQVFASDIDEHAIRTARAGVYPASIMADVPAARLERHFTRDGERYKVRKAMRESVLFASHNLLHDPPFSRVDLITCRNLLIYLNRDLHRQVLEQFHFALNPGGYLFLGSAETADIVSHLFTPIDTRHRIYQAKPHPRDMHRTLAIQKIRETQPLPVERKTPAPVSQRGRLFSYADIHLHRAAELAPPSILIDAKGEIVHIDERAGRFLHHPGGVPTRDIVALVLPELRLQLRAALFQSQQSGQRASTGPVRADTDGDPRTIDMAVMPIHDPHADGLLMLVIFHDMPSPQPMNESPAGPATHPLLMQLEENLHHTTLQLQETIEQAEISDAQMRATHEELQSTVEELRSAVEELETSREELQSTNEELLTVNQQLKLKMEETVKSHDDLNNLIASSDLATLFLDRDMRIVRYTPKITGIFNVIPADIGRPLSHLASKLDYPGLTSDAVKVLDTLQPMEREIQSHDGRFYIVRVHPYRTTEDRIEGAVMSFFDITRRRLAEQALRETEQAYRTELERQVQERTAELKASRDLLQATMDASMDMIQVFTAVRDERGDIVDFHWALNNHTSESKYGEVYGQSLLQRNPGVIQEGIFADFKQVVETGVAQQVERHYAHEQFDGWFLQSVVKLGDGVATTTKEITDWKKSQEEILRLRDELVRNQMRESEAKVRHLMDIIPVAVYVCGADGAMSYCNAQAVALWGCRPDEQDADFALRGAWRIRLPDGTPLEPGDWPMARVLATGDAITNQECRIERPDGVMIDVMVDITPLRDKAGKIDGALLMLQDITERKMMEAALRESEARFQALITATSYRMYRMSADWREMRELDGRVMLSGATSPASGWMEAFLHPEDLPLVRAAIKEAIDRRAVFELEHRMRRVDGSFGWILSRAVPVFDQHGEILEWIGAASDIGAVREDRKDEAGR